MPYRHIWRWISLIYLSLFIAGCAVAPPQPMVIVYKEVFLNQLCAQYDIPWERSLKGRTVTLHGPLETAQFTLGTSTVRLGNQDIALSAQVRAVNESIVVPTDFKRKVIEPLMRRGPITKQVHKARQREVMLDAGHGGKDPGTRGKSGLQEKEVVLDITKRTKRFLEKHGFKVHMTRTQDKFVSLKKRTEMSSKARIDLFVSLHANASPESSAHGLEVFTARPLDLDGRREAQRRSNYRRLFKDLAMQRNHKILGSIVDDLMYTHKQAMATRLAMTVASETSESLATHNRGVKTAGFFVLRNTLIPAVLVEIGFLSNPREERLLSSKAFRQKVARGVAKSIIDFLESQ